MGNALRVCWDHLGLALPLSVTSENAAADFRASNLETGNLQRFWQATSTAEQTLTYDAGSGLLKTCDTVILPRADLLVAVGANVAVQWSNDAATGWTDAFTAEVPIQTNDLLAPDARHYLKEFPSLSKRGWRVRIYGTPSAPASLAGGLFLGARTELPTSPAYGFEMGVSRSVLGRDLMASWPPLSRTGARALATVLAAVTPDAAEVPVSTVSGVFYGGLPHWLYDPLGRTLADDPATLTPTLLPVLCVSPEAAKSASLTPSFATGPTQVRWRERR